MEKRSSSLVTVVLALVGCAGGGSTNVGHGGDGSTQQPTDGGSSDAYQGDFGDFAAPSASAARVLAQLETYATGGTIDDNGDGVADVTITVGSDGTHTVSVAGPGGLERQHTVRTSATSWTVEGDQDGDGTSDESITSSLSGSTVTFVWNRDTDADHTFDWRSTVTTDVGTAGARPQVFTVEELLTPIGGGSPAYIATSAYATNSPEKTCTPTAAAKPGPNPPACWYDDLPETYAATINHSIPIGFGNHFRVMTDGAMRCNVTQVARLSQTLDRALGDIDEIGDVNPGWRDLLRQLLSVSPIVYGCANPSCLPSNVVATTRGFGLVPFGNTEVASITSISPAILAEGLDGVEELVLHEWFHAAGISHPVDPDGENQRDFIYSCARHGNHCRGFDYYLGVKSDASSARDAAMCADRANKPRFGVQPLFVDKDTGFVQTQSSTQPVPLLCSTGSMVAPSGACQCFLMEDYTYCDQSLLSEATRNSTMKYDTFTCCETCSSATPTNDDSCVAAHLAPTLHYAAPACDKVGSCLY